MWMRLLTGIDFTRRRGICEGREKIRNSKGLQADFRSGVAQEALREGDEITGSAVRAPGHAAIIQYAHDDAAQGASQGADAVAGR